jgi:hypothetical protein
MIHKRTQIDEEPISSMSIPGHAGQGRQPWRNKRPPDLLSQDEWAAIGSQLRLSQREAEMLRSACYNESVNLPQRAYRSRGT